MMEPERNGTGGRGAERAVGERSDAAAKSGEGKEPPNPELVERPQRRRFSAEYKLRIVEEADRCTELGEVGSLLRREGLYSSHLSQWRKQRDEGALQALGRRRGRKKAHRAEAEAEKLRKRAERAEAELEKARKVIEVQGNVSALLEELLQDRGAKPDGSGDG